MRQSNEETTRSIYTEKISVVWRKVNSLLGEMVTDLKLNTLLFNTVEDDQSSIFCNIYYSLVSQRVITK